MFKLIYTETDGQLAEIVMSANLFITEAEAMCQALDREVGDFEIHDIEKAKQFTVYYATLEDRGSGKRSYVNKGVSDDDKDKAEQEWISLKNQGLDAIVFDNARREFWNP